MEEQEESDEVIVLLYTREIESGLASQIPMLVSDVLRMPSQVCVSVSIADRSV